MTPPDPDAQGGRPPRGVGGSGLDDLPASRSVVDWIGAACARYGDAIAVTGVGGPRSFESLWQRATSLAGVLVAGGVQRGDLVGIWAEQSSDLLVGIVGIMAAGAAYVPIDPSFPAGRLEFFARDASLSCVVASTRTAAAAAQLGVEVIPADAPPSAPGPLPATDAHDAAYVIYTSGSTGSPKGVVIEHGSLVNLLEWLVGEFDVRPGDVTMATATPAFDASVPNLLLPLVTGGCFVALERQTAADPFALAASIDEQHPRVLQTSPTMLRMLTEVGWKGDRALEVWTGGERTAPAVIRYVAPRVAALCNFYGPTEVTVDVAVARLAPDDAIDPPVGRPMPFARCLVLDASGAPVPTGEVGELFVAGPQLARGYLHDPALTAARFVEVAWDDGAATRAFRTGDLARVRPDGALVILGRIDDQVKIRGYRIEPGEIEHRLEQHPDVDEAVVLALQSSEHDEPRLVAAVRTARAVSDRALRGFVREALPVHMVPAVIVEIDAVPLTATGKVDRQRLATLVAENAGRVRADDEQHPLPGASDLERSVLQMYAVSLSVPEAAIGLDDDFFDIGGTSLRCARLFMMIEARHSVRLPLSTLVTAGTPRLLAREIAAGRDRAHVERRTPDKPRHEWERILATLWSECLAVGEVQRTDDFFSLGGSDAAAEEMLGQLRTQYGAEVTLADLRRSPSIVALAALIGSRVARPSLVPLTTGPGVPFFCIAGAGGLAVTFLPLARMLGDDQPFYALQAHGIEQRGRPDLTLRATADRYEREILSTQPTGPYLLGGHSLGGVLALMVAHRLEARGERVALLAIFDTVLTERMVGAELPMRTSSRSMWRWRAADGLPRLSTVLRLPLIGIVPQRGIAQFDVFAALGEVQAMLAGRLPAWAGEAIVFVSGADAEAANVEFGWSRLLTGQWSCVTVPGDHLSMLEGSHIATAAAHLHARIAEVLGADRSGPAPTPEP